MPVARKVWLPILVLTPARRRPPLDHPVRILLPKRVSGELEADRTT